MTLADTARALSAERIVHGGRLKRGGLRELRESMRYWEQHDRRAYVLMLNSGEKLGDYRLLVEAMGLHRERELLLVCNGQHWEATGWGLSTEQLRGILFRSQDDLDEYWAKGLVAALDGAGEASIGSARITSPSSGTLTVGGVAVAATTGGLGWIIWRRRVRLREQVKGVNEAVEAAQARCAELMLNVEVLEQHVTEELQDSAVRIYEELVRVAEWKRIQPESPRRKLARVQQLDNELSALESRILTEHRKGKTQ